MGGTLLGDVDLTGWLMIEEVKHGVPSLVTVGTLAQTLRSGGGRFSDETLTFLVRAGVPETLLEYLPSLLESNPLQFYTCFLSYSTKDEEFAAALHRDLEEAGVKTWKWDLDAIPGRDLRENIDRAVRHYDKMVLICSISSLTSKAVDREVETALQKEERLSAAKAEGARSALAKGEREPYVDTDVLIPIRLDDTLFRWESALAPQVKRKFIPDFSGAPPNSAKYEEQVHRLVQALNPKAWPPAAPGPRRATRS